VRRPADDGGDDDDGGCDDIRHPPTTCCPLTSAATAHQHTPANERQVNANRQLQAHANYNLI